jgi:hypothetical protein
MSQLPEVMDVPLSGRQVFVSEDLLGFDERDVVRNQDACCKVTNAV